MSIFLTVSRYYKTETGEVLYLHAGLLAPATADSERIAMNVRTTHQRLGAIVSDMREVAGPLVELTDAEVLQYRAEEAARDQEIIAYNSLAADAEDSAEVDARLAKSLRTYDA